MVHFYQGKPESVMERLSGTISNFDSSWGSKCVPASDGQIQQSENICAEYGYHVPKVYLDYLKAMGESDGGLLEREWDGYMEPNLHTILELFCDEDFEAKEYLQRGFFCFLTSAVTDWQNHYFAGSFEKYLVQIGDKQASCGRKDVAAQQFHFRTHGKNLL